MQLYPSSLMRLVLPALLLAGALLGRGYLLQLSPEVQILVQYVPYLAAAAALFMAFQFNRMRPLLAALWVAGMYWWVQEKLQTSLTDVLAARDFLTLAIAAPITLSYIALVPERGLLSFAGAVLLSLGALLAGISWHLARLEGAADLLPHIMSASGQGVGLLPLALRGLFLCCGVAVLLVLLRRNQDLDAALLVALFAVYGLLERLDLADISVVLASAAGLAVVYGVVRNTHALAYRDELTGLLSRRALNERLKRLGRTYTIAMLDVDHFKRCNDTYGHDVGDQVLRMVGSKLLRVGEGGTAYRYGGEEFCLLFPRRSLDECIEAIEAVRQSVADYGLSVRDSRHRPVSKQRGSQRRGATRLGKEQIVVTLSGGAAEKNEKQPDALAVIQAADSKLYAAKRAGRNRLKY